MRRRTTQPEAETSTAVRRVELLRALNAAAASLQRSARSEAEVFRAVHEQISTLGLSGGMGVLESRGQRLVVRVAAYPAHRQLLASLELITRLKVEGFEIDASQVAEFRQMLETRAAIFVPHNGKIIAQLVPALTRAVVERVLDAFGEVPAVYAPLVIEDRLIGILGMSGASLTEADVSAVEAFANHIAVALENARLFAAVQESEERYRKLVELSPDAIGVHSAGRVEYVNPAAVRLFGGSRPEDLIGKPVFDFVHPDFKEIVLKRVQKGYELGQPAELLVEKMIRLDGQVIDVEVVATPIQYQGKPAVQLIIRDIAQRVRSESIRAATQRISEAALITRDVQALFRSIHDVIS